MPERYDIHLPALAFSDVGLLHDDGVIALLEGESHGFMAPPDFLVIEGIFVSGVEPGVAVEAVLTGEFEGVGILHLLAVHPNTGAAVAPAAGGGYAGEAEPPPAEAPPKEPPALMPPETAGADETEAAGAECSTTGAGAEGAGLEVDAGAEGTVYCGVLSSSEDVSSEVASASVRGWRGSATQGK